MGNVRLQGFTGQAVVAGFGTGSKNRYSAPDSTTRSANWCACSNAAHTIHQGVSHSHVLACACIFICKLACGCGRAQCFALHQTLKRANSDLGCGVAIIGFVRNRASCNAQRFGVDGGGFCFTGQGVVACLVLSIRSIGQGVSHSHVLCGGCALCIAHHVFAGKLPNGCGGTQGFTFHHTAKCTHGDSGIGVAIVVFVGHGGARNSQRLLGNIGFQIGRCNGVVARIGAA